MLNNESQIMIIQLLPIERKYEMEEGVSPYHVIFFKRIENEAEKELFKQELLKYKGVAIDAFYPEADKNQRRQILQSSHNLLEYLTFLQINNIPYIVYEDTKIHIYKHKNFTESELEVGSQDLLRESLSYLYSACNGFIG